MQKKLPPPSIRKFKLSQLDYLLFGLVGALGIYVFWRIENVLVYHWNWTRVFNYIAYFDEKTGSLVPNLLLQGLATTIRLALWGMLYAFVVGLLMGYWRTCNVLILRLISRIYVELIRNIPPVVFIFILCNKTVILL